MLPYDFKDLLSRVRSGLMLEGAVALEVLIFIARVAEFLLSRLYI
jgi:hypothetical protein